MPILEQHATSPTGWRQYHIC